MTAPDLRVAGSLQGLVWITSMTPTQLIDHRWTSIPPHMVWITEFQIATPATLVMVLGILIPSLRLRLMFLLTVSTGSQPRTAMAVKGVSMIDPLLLPSHRSSHPILTSLVALTEWTTLVLEVFLLTAPGQKIHLTPVTTGFPVTTSTPLHHPPRTLTRPEWSSRTASAFAALTPWGPRLLPTFRIGTRACRALPTMSSAFPTQLQVKDPAKDFLLCFHLHRLAKGLQF